MALAEKIRKLEARRARSKHKLRWDKRNGVKLAVHKRQARTLRAKLLEALQAQGQFEHDDLGGSRARANQNE